MRILAIALLLAACQGAISRNQATTPDSHPPAKDSSFFGRLTDAAVSLTRQQVAYDPSYYVIPYPNGDIPAGKGVCSDVVIRAYRELGIDLQQNIHEDMVNHFDLYPKNWGLPAPDKNIDHRRVPNLMTYFTRKDAGKPISTKTGDYQPGDIVCWMLPGNLTHIGIVIDSTADDKTRKLIVHNIGRGQVVEDCLFSYTIIGHYRYKPD